MKPTREKMKGRGTASVVDNRYSDVAYEHFDDGWDSDTEEATQIKTTVTMEQAKTIITQNQSPDLPFSQSINPYRGCEHGCSYCYARPAHAYMDLSPGLDFETRLFAKKNAAGLLKQALVKPGYQPCSIALGSNTDPYQPVERQHRVTRDIIQVLHDTHHPFTIVTKSALVLRDIDLLAPMAELGLVKVFISVTTLNSELSRKLEPRTSAPARRLQALEQLHQHGIPTGVMFAPVIPVINDTEMENVLKLAAAKGVQEAGYVMLRLPLEVRPIFKEWLELHEPLKAKHVMSMVRDIRDGKENNSEFKQRMVGTGHFAEIIAKRFQLACKKHNLNYESHKLRTDLFRPQVLDDQMSLF